jgi:hypothetical protein
MPNEVSGPGGLPAGPVPGAIRFGKEGRLEIFGEDGWTPLQQVSDADMPPITRKVPPAPPAESDETGDPDGQAPT